MISQEEMARRCNDLVEKVSPIFDADGNAIVQGNALAHLMAYYIVSAPEPIRGQVMMAAFKAVCDLVNDFQEQESERANSRLH